MHPVIAFEGVAEGQIAEMCLFSAWWDFGSDHRFLEQHIQAEQERLVRIEARLRSLEQGDGLPVYEVVLKAVKAITAVSLHLTTTDLASQAHWSDVLGATLQHYGVKPIDHLLVLHSESEDEHTPGSVEMVAPVAWSDANALVPYVHAYGGHHTYTLTSEQNKHALVLNIKGVRVFPNPQNDR